jgi:hypothetical protein
LFTTKVLTRKGAWFAPYIDDAPGGCVVVWFHNDDITDEGCGAFADVFTELARRWRPREPGTPRGPRIPITMDRRPVMPEGMAIVVDDHVEYIHYTVRADLISERGAMCLTRMLSERIPDYVRGSARSRAQLRAV